jgi:hypothetical protein
MTSARYEGTGSANNERKLGYAPEDKQSLMQDFVELLCHGWTVDGAIKMLKDWATVKGKYVNLKRELVEGESHPSFGRAVPSRKTFYVWRDEPGNEQFRDDWKESFDIGTEVLEDLGMNLAHAGSEKMVMFLLKARNPGRYANFGALGGGSFNISITPADEAL